MNVLTIDTATERLDVSLTTDAGAFFEHSISSGFTHTERLMPVINTLIEESKMPVQSLDLIVCARCPGSFTGLRIGMATAKGLRMATGAKLVSVPTLDAMAYSYAWYPGAVIPVVDARRKRVYSGLYVDGRLTGGYLDIAPEELAIIASEYKACLIVSVDGSLATEVGELFENSRCAIVQPSGRAYAALGELRLFDAGEDTPDAGPVYLRASDAEEKLKGAT